MNDTITIKYSCPQCGLNKVETPVRMRRSEEDVVQWMRQEVEVTIWQDHQRRSPSCRAITLRDIMIPLTGVQWIGGPPIQ